MKKTVKDENQYIYKSTVLTRKGWTDKALQLFLPNHDKEVKNPHYKSSPPSKLYDITKVEAVEASEKFALFVQNGKKRSEGAQQAVETKRENLMKYVTTFEIKVPTIAKAKLIEKGVEHYNLVQQDWFYNKGGHKKQNVVYTATVNSDEFFLKRIVLNYLRHELTSYENELFRIFGKVGTDEAYQILKDRINATIIEKYSWLG